MFLPLLLCNLSVWISSVVNIQILQILPYKDHTRPAITPSVFLFQLNFLTEPMHMAACFDIKRIRAVYLKMAFLPEADVWSRYSDQTECRW